MGKDNFHFAYSKGAMDAIRKYNIDLKVIEQHARAEVRKLIGTKKTPMDFAKEFPDEKTWGNYLIVGKASKSDGFSVEITELAKLSKRASCDESIKIYTIEDDSCKDRLSIPEHIEQLKKKATKNQN